MTKFTTDNLSFWLGKFDQDCYLINRGIRMLGSHNLKNSDYTKLEQNIFQIAKKNEVEIEIIKGKKLVDILVFHPIEGLVWLDKLRELDKKLDKNKDNKVLETIFEKLIKKQKLSEIEKKLLQDHSRENKELDLEFGKVFGYSDSSIRRSLDNN